MVDPIEPIDPTWFSATATDTHYTLQFTADPGLDGEWIVVDTEDYREEPTPPPDPFLNHYLEE